MRKRIVVLSLVLLFAALTSASQVFGQTYINVMADPVDTARQINWQTECIVTISPQENRTFEVFGGSGRVTRGLLRPGTVVVVDRETGLSRWVLGCGNPININNAFAPRGARHCVDRVVQVPGLPGQTGPQGPQGPQGPPGPVTVTKKRNWWLPILTAVAGGVIGHFAFPRGKKEDGPRPPTVNTR